MKRITRFFDQIPASIHFFKTHRLKRNYRRALLFFAILLPVCVVAIIAGQRLHQPTPSSSKAAIALSTTKKKQQRHKATSHKTKVHTAPKNIDWTAPSEKQAYPDLTQHPNITLDVNLKKQRVFIKEGDKTLYTMYASTGIDDSTPRGDFAIQDERGYEFFNPNEQMGAHYYTSFYLHGTYLFHTVPTDVGGQYIKNEAAKLGKEPGSHGCVRLSIADAKWIFEHVPTGTPVKVY